MLTVTKDGTEYEVKLEYPEGLYDSMNSLMDATLTNNQGNSGPCAGNRPGGIYGCAPDHLKVDGKYQISLTAATLPRGRRFTAQKTTVADGGSADAAGGRGGGGGIW